MLRKLTVTALGVCLSLSSYCQTPPKPNVIFIVFDDLNDYIEGLNGDPQVLTPNIKQLEEDGTLFTNAFCSAPGCAPSRTSFLSGKDIDYTKIYNDEDYEGNFRGNFTPATGNPVVYTIPQVLKDKGSYFTFTIGKVFHSEVEGDMDDSGRPMCEKHQSWNRQCTYQEPTWFINQCINYQTAPGYSFSLVPDSLEKYIDDYALTDTAIQFIHSVAAGTANTCGHPFFMALGYHKPHVGRFIPQKYFSGVPPYYVQDVYATPFIFSYNHPANAYPPNGIVMPPQPTVPLADYYALPEGGMGRSLADNGSFEPAISDYIGSLFPDLPSIAPGLDDSDRIRILQETERANYVAAYMGAVQFGDAQVGRLLDELESHPAMMNHTIIVLLSDHGYSLGEKGHYTKWGLWETDIRVPFIIIDPSKPGNKICTRSVSLLDLFPTIMDMTGVTTPTMPDGSPYTDGMSLKSLLVNPNKIFERPVLTTYKPSFACLANYSVRSDRFHYIFYQHETDPCVSTETIPEAELYEIGVNREVDPNEWKNLAYNSDYAPVINYLQKFLPDSSLYLKQANKVIITNPAEPCFLSHSTKIKLKCNIYDLSGIAIPPSGLVNYTFRWTNNLTSAVSTGPAYTFAMNTVPVPMFATHDRILFYLQVFNQATGALVGFDTKTFYINTANTPAAVFNVHTTPALTAQISDYTITGTYSDITWDFGDGFITHDSLPATHTYAEGGSYVIKNIIAYGNGCSETFEHSISFADSERKPEIGDWKVFPNPASTILTVSGYQSSIEAQAEIINMQGQIVLPFVLLPGPGQQVNISALPAGFYTLRIRNNNSTTVKNFMIVH